MVLDVATALLVVGLLSIQLEARQEVVQTFSLRASTRYHLPQTSILEGEVEEELEEEEELRQEVVEMVRHQLKNHNVESLVPISPRWNWILTLPSVPL